MDNYENLEKWHPTLEQEYAMALGYSPFISHPDLCHVDGPGLPTYDEWMEHVKEVVAEYRKKKKNAV